jgi:hypothetical protein
MPARVFLQDTRNIGGRHALLSERAVHIAKLRRIRAGVPSSTARGVTRPATARGRPRTAAGARPAPPAGPKPTSARGQRPVVKSKDGIVDATPEFVQSVRARA